MTMQAGAQNSNGSLLTDSEGTMKADVKDSDGDGNENNMAQITEQSNLVGNKLPITYQMTLPCVAG